MLLIIATISVLGVLLLFIWDTSRDQENNSNIFSYYTPFFAESVVTHHYLSSPESVWKTLSDLDSYQSWFPQIKRLLPDSDTDRYVHQFSFDRFSLLPGARLLLRPNSWSPFYKSRVVVVNKNEKITALTSFSLTLEAVFKKFIIRFLIILPPLLMIDNLSSITIKCLKKFCINFVYAYTI